MFKSRRSQWLYFTPITSLHMCSVISVTFPSIGPWTDPIAFHLFTIRIFLYGNNNLLSDISKSPPLQCKTFHFTSNCHFTDPLALLRKSPSRQFRPCHLLEASHFAHRNFTHSSHTTWTLSYTTTSLPFTSQATPMNPYCLHNSPWKEQALNSKFLSAHHSFFLFHWSTIAWQCCVSFCCTTKWVSYMYTYMLSLLDLSPIPAIPPI